MLGFVKRNRRLSVRLPCTILLIEHEILEIQNAKLLQCVFTLRGIFIPGSGRLSSLNQTLKIGGDNQTRAFLVQLGDAIMKRSRGETAGSPALDHPGEILKLIEFWIGGKEILLDPDEQLVH